MTESVIQHADGLVHHRQDPGDLLGRADRRNEVTRLTERLGQGEAAGQRHVPDLAAADHALDGKVAGVPGFVAPTIFEVLLDKVARTTAGAEDRAELPGGAHEADVPATTAFGRLHDGGVADPVGKCHRPCRIEPGGCRPERGTGDAGSVEHGALHLLVDERTRNLRCVVAQPDPFGQESGIHDVVVDEGHDALDPEPVELLGEGVEVLTGGVDNGPEPSDEAQHLLGLVPGVHDPYEFGALAHAAS